MIKSCGHIFIIFDNINKLVHIIEHCPVFVSDNLWIFDKSKKVDIVCKECAATCELIGVGGVIYACELP